MLPDIQKLVLRPSWYDDHITLLDTLLFARDNRLAFAVREEENLVDGVFLQISVSTTITYIPQFQFPARLWLEGGGGVPHHQSPHSRGLPSQRTASIDRYG